MVNELETIVGSTNRESVPAAEGLRDFNESRFIPTVPHSPIAANCLREMTSGEEKLGHFIVIGSNDARPIAPICLRMDVVGTRYPGYISKRSGVLVINQSAARKSITH